MGHTGLPNQSNNVTSFHVSISDNIECLIKQFWEIEEPPILHSNTLENIRAQEIYINTI